MKFKVKCTLGTLGEAIEAIELIERNRDYDELINRFISYLAQDGKEEATKGYRHINYAGDTQVNVMTVDRDNGSKKIIAQSEAIAFIEWGAGKTFGVDPNPFGGVGSYGQHKGHRNSWAYYGQRGTAYDDHLEGGARMQDRHVKGTWASNDHDSVVRVKKRGTLYWTAGNPPNRVLSNTMEYLRDELEDVAEEVFGE